VLVPHSNRKRFVWGVGVVRYVLYVASLPRSNEWVFLRVIPWNCRGNWGWIPKLSTHQKKKNAKSPHTQRLKTPYENHSVSGQGWFGSAHTRTPTSGLVWVFQTEVRVILFNSMGFCFVVVMFRSFLCQCLREKKRHFVWTIS